MQDKEKQFLEGYDAYSDALFRFAYFQVSDREVARDIVQDVFMETWKCIADGGEIQNVRAYLYRVARNRIIDYYRKNKTQSLDAIQDNSQGKRVDFEDERGREKEEAQMEASHMLRLLDKVGQKYRAPVLLRYMEGMGTKEVAEILGETESNASVLIHRGLEQLKKLAHL